MSEDDHSSGSGASDTSGADDSGGSGSSWAASAWDAVTLPFPDGGGTTRRGGGSGKADAESPAFNRALQRIFEARGPVVDDRSLPRQIVEHPRWYLLRGPDGRDLLEAVPANERARRPFARALGDGQPVRSPKTGRRGALQVAQAFAALPDAVPGPDAVAGPAVREVSGRELARALPAGADGVLFTLAAGETVGLLRDEWPVLEPLAAGLDLEEILVRPGPGQLPALLAARWYLSSKHGLKPQEFGGSRIIRVYTHPDRVETRDDRTTALGGLELAQRLAGRSDYDGVMVNLGSHVGMGDELVRAYSLGPDFGPSLVRGTDPRPGAEPLPARTLAEVHLWLDLVGFPAPRRELVPVVPASGTATLVQARCNPGSTWRNFETAYRQPERPGPTLGPVFSISQPDAPPGVLGDGPTMILCAGHLAKHLYDHNSWRPPRWFVAKEHRVRAARMAGWAHELLKLLPPGANKLPRSALRTLAGAEFLRHRRQFASRAWIEEQYARYDGTVRRGWLGL